MPPSPCPLNIVILGLSITSSWGNGHATCYRGLVRALARRGHRVLFLERDRPWYAAHRDMPQPAFGETRLYQSLDELRDEFTEQVRDADLVIVGSYVPDGVAAGQWVVNTCRGLASFYDIDTPVTLAKLARGDYEYVSPDLISRYDLYLSFTGGPILALLEQRYSAALARPFYCAVDPDLYYPEDRAARYELGYMGTYSSDRQPTVDRLLVQAARRLPDRQFVVAGPQYPADLEWPGNVERVAHVPPSEHRGFYGAQRLTLNVTRQDMIRAGFAPSVRLFEAAACGTPIVSDGWEGLNTFFAADREILIGRSTEDVVRHLHSMNDERRQEMAAAARARVLAEHTWDHRAEQLEQYCRTAWQRRPRGGQCRQKLRPGSIHSAPAG